MINLAICAKRNDRYIERARLARVCCTCFQLLHYALVRMRKRGIRQCVCVSVCLHVQTATAAQRSMKWKQESFYRLLVAFSCSWICKIMHHSRVIARFAWNAIVAPLQRHCSLFRTVRSETCSRSVATLLSSQLCTRTLAVFGSYKSQKRAALRFCCTVESRLFGMEIL